MDYGTTFLETNDIQLKILSHLSNEDIYNYTSTCQSLCYKKYTTLYCIKFLNLWKSNLLIEKIEKNLLATINPYPKINELEEKIKNIQSKILKVQDPIELKTIVNEQMRQIQILLNSILFSQSHEIRKEILAISTDITSNFLISDELKNQFKTMSQQIENIDFLKKEIFADPDYASSKFDKKFEEIFKNLPVDNVCEILQSLNQEPLFNLLLKPIGKLLEHVKQEEQIQILDSLVILQNRFPNDEMLNTFLEDWIMILIKEHRLEDAARYFQRNPPDLCCLLWIIRDLYLEDQNLVFNDILALYHQFEIPNYRRVELALRSFNSPDDLAFACQNIGTLSDFLPEGFQLFDVSDVNFQNERMIYELISLALVKFDKYDQLPSFILENCIMDKAILAHLLIYLSKKLSFEEFKLFLKQVKTQCNHIINQPGFVNLLARLGFPFYNEI